MRAASKKVFAAYSLMRLVQFIYNLITKQKKEKVRSPRNLSMLKQRTLQIIIQTDNTDSQTVLKVQKPYRREHRFCRS